MSSGIFSKLFAHKELLGFGELGTDLHSHLIPGIDDGASTIEESIAMITGLQQMGYTRFITTPHIQPELFPNTEKSITEQLGQFKTALAEQHIDCHIEAAAEYYVDETFENRLATGEKFLSFGDNYILIEVSMISKFIDLEKILFELMLLGYKVILAHVERYPYMFERHNLDYYSSLKDKEIFLQVNLRSFTGDYGDIQKKIARQLAEHRMIDFLGTDLHKPKQLQVIEQAMHDEHVQQLLASGSLLNKTL